MEALPPNNSKPEDILVGQEASHVVTWHVGVLVATCLLLFLLNAGSLPLADPEEARCGLIVQETLQHGHWLVPHLHGKPYFAKPVPFFWLAAAALRHVTVADGPKPGMKQTLPAMIEIS